MIVSGICVSSGLLILSENSKLKYGAVLFAGVMAYFVFYPYLKNPSGIGPVSGKKLYLLYEAFFFFIS